jgi:hypothetical protein
MNLKTTAEPPTCLEPQPTGLVDEQGRRIRWERHPSDSTLLVVLDSLTGTVIAVVRNLFAPQVY